MNTLLLYLLKVALAISLVTIPYYFLLRNDALLVVKRIYLFGGIALAWIFPFVAVSKPDLAPVLEPIFFMDPGVVTPTSGDNTLVQNTVRSISGSTIVGLLYLTGIALLFLKNTLAFIKSKSDRTNDLSDNKDVVITNSDQIYTIFPKIFIPKKIFNKF